METLFRLAVRPVGNRPLDLPLERLLLSSTNADLLRVMAQLYRDLDSDIAGQPGHCWLKTACCRFDAVNGHRLFVTAIEVCYYLSQRSPPPATGNICAHLANGLCNLRDVRPLACRIYYCDPLAQDWQAPMAERYLARLRKLHVELGVEYFYADWLLVLEAIRTHDCPRPTSMLPSADRSDGGVHK